MSTLQQAIALVQMGVDSSTLDHQGAAAASHRNHPQPSVDESGNHPFHHHQPSAMTHHQQRSQQQMVPQHQVPIAISSLFKPTEIVFRPVVLDSVPYINISIDGKLSAPQS